MANVVLEMALARLTKARSVLAAHEAAAQMHRDNGDLKAARSAQARVNGYRTMVGKAVCGVRQAGGRVQHG